MVLSDKLSTQNYQNDQLLDKITKMEELVKSIQFKYDDSKEEINQLKERYEQKIIE